MNTFGHILRLTTFGESHGEAIGGVLDGFPAGIEIDLKVVQYWLDRRRPGQSSLTTQRSESDGIEVLSGLFQGQSTGAPIAFIIRNQDKKSEDYEHLKTVFRPSHADFTYQTKYGIRDYRGGGRSSARETAVRVAAGAFASHILAEAQIQIHAFVSQIGHLKLMHWSGNLTEELIESNAVRCPDSVVAAQMIELIEKIRDEGDSIGGVISCHIQNAPVGLGAPIYAKLHADLAHAMMSINATKGFDYGDGFEGLTLKGSEQNDEWIDGKLASNHSGGIQGGISNGAEIRFRVAFKPTATISKTQRTLNMAGEQVDLSAKGRHDPCVLPRAVPIVKAMAALVTADHVLLNQTVTLKK